MSDEKSHGPHQFWNTQPVLQSEENKAVVAGPLDKPKTVEEIPAEPYPIASTFEWWVPDLQQAEDLTAIYELLRDNYVEDDDSMFRFKYSEDFLRWALTPPDYIPEWHVAVRRRKDQKVLAFISGIPITMQMGMPVNAEQTASQSAEATGESAPENYREPRRICEINFLCIHKMLREKRLAPILIKEVTRRVNLRNIWQAVYTAGTMLPTPFASGRYYHRSINLEKLVEIRFCGIKQQFARFQNPMLMMKRAYKLPDKHITKGLREMTEADVPQVTKLLTAYLSRYDVHPVFDEKEVKHYLLPREGVLSTFVVEAHNEITDFFSFYSLPSTVIGNAKYSQLNAAYVHYYAVNKTPVEQLMKDLLIAARDREFDVCNMVCILENEKFINDLQFNPGDGVLHYYFYNWSYPKLDPSRVGLVML